MNIDACGQLVELLSGMYPTFRVEKNTIKGYQLMLQDIPFDLVKAALPAILIRHPTFCPTAPELRIALMDAMSTTPSAAEAWEEIEQQLKRVGSWGRPTFTDPLIERAVNAIGWEEICLTEFEQMGTLRAQFRQLYETFRAKQSRDQVAIGMSAAHVTPLKAVGS